MIESSATVPCHLENLQRLGYTVLEGVISPQEAQDIERRLDGLYADQLAEYGEGRLRELNEFEIHRGLLDADERFAQLVEHPRILEIVDHVLGPTAILNPQNASAAFPGSIHFQSRLHRDFAKDFVATRPLALNAFWIITDFTTETGATWI